jgi:hypothetical protein
MTRADRAKRDVESFGVERQGQAGSGSDAVRAGRVALAGYALSSWLVNKPAISNFIAARCLS